MNFKRILIVDDDANVREMLRMIVEYFCPEIEIALASNGSMALEQMEMYPNSAPCDLVLTDYNMPLMDGLELTRVINSDWPDTRVVLMSGSLSRYLIHEKGADLKIETFMTKPFGIEQLRKLFQC